MIDEKVDVLDARGEKTDRSAWKSEAHRLGLWHRCFHCWVVAPDVIPSGGPYLFVQRRAAEKDTWPNKLDVTVGGHLKAGESALDGLREVEEETGLRCELGDIPAGGARGQPCRSSPHRSLLEVSTPIRWPAAVAIPTGTRMTSSQRLPHRSPVTSSTTAAASARRVNSTGTNAR
jgi:ADP-ribose pyrophosphatase YjhB (NUDIX family)